MDDVDLAIIGSLQNDGRKSYAAIARELGLSGSGVRQRVEKLVARGLVRFFAVVEPVTLGCVRSSVAIRVRGAEVGDVAAVVAGLTEADFVALCAGPYDIVADLTCASDQHLLELVDKSIRSLPGVDGAVLFLHLSIVKNDYQLVDIIKRGRSAWLADGD
jgi:Lrp/AsnC family transcriptional regulator for asnA, asnC and gidA